MEKKRCYLAWKLIEAKLLYYKPELFTQDVVNARSITDEEYDKLDREYLTLCKDLGLSNTVSHNIYPGLENVQGMGMFEVDLTRPSVQLVINKLKELEGRC